MKPIQEVFLETEWGDEDAARQARDEKACELQAQGLICNCENLYTVDGYRVFLVEATEAELEDAPPSRRDRYSSTPRRSERPVPKSSSPEQGDRVEHPPNLYRKRKEG
ncbi:MAG TPA: hypothetical protein V6C78_22580 [Crinalium sp.]|jgi:hypothetical protein